MFCKEAPPRPQALPPAGASALCLCGPWPSITLFSRWGNRSPRDCKNFSPAPEGQHRLGRQLSRRPGRASGSLRWSSRAAPFPPRSTWPVSSDGARWFRSPGAGHQGPQQGHLRQPQRRTLQPGDGSRPRQRSALPRSHGDEDGAHLLSWAHTSCASLGAWAPLRCPLGFGSPAGSSFPMGRGGSRAHARPAARAGRPLPGYAAACEPFQRRGPGHAPKGGPSCEREGRPRGSPRRCRTDAAGASRLLSPPGPARGSTGGGADGPAPPGPAGLCVGGCPPPLSLTPRVCRTRRRRPRHECAGGARSAPGSTRTLRPGGCCSWRRAAALLREPQLREASLSSQESGGLPLSASGLLGSAGRSALRCLQQALAALAPGSVRFGAWHASPAPPGPKLGRPGLRTPRSRAAELASGH